MCKNDYGSTVYKSQKLETTYTHHLKNGCINCGYIHTTEHSKALRMGKLQRHEMERISLSNITGAKEARNEREPFV